MIRINIYLIKWNQSGHSNAYSIYEFILFLYKAQINKLQIKTCFCAKSLQFYFPDLKSIYKKANDRNHWLSLTPNNHLNQLWKKLTLDFFRL